MNESASDFEQLKLILREFAAKRNWEQFHTPKNLSMAIAGEAGELVAEFQWMSADESHPASLTPEQMESVSMEIADVQIYLIRLADVLGIDIPGVVRKKVSINEDRF